jgi:hypothetical protein
MRILARYWCLWVQYYKLLLFSNIMTLSKKKKNSKVILSLQISLWHVQNFFGTLKLFFERPLLLKIAIIEIEKGKRGRKRKERRGLSVPRTYQPGTNASSTLLDVAAAHIVGPGCLQGSLGYRILPEAEKSHNIKQANPRIPSDTEP